jgi:hypothetical protein
VTTAANATMATIHDRMPVILPASAWDTWLDPDNQDLDALGKLLVPAPDTLLTLHPISTDVNKVANDDAHLIDPIEIGARRTEGPTSPDDSGARTPDDAGREDPGRLVLGGDAVRRVRRR